MERAFQPEACDFSGWATRNDLKCSDGRVIRRDAFKHDDGIKVPLVWNHQHNDPRNVLGHAWLENRPEGVYTYGFFNDSESGEIGKILVKHGDICALSIYANQLQQRGCDVLHGEILEVSLVHAGANPGAFIDSMLKHGEDSDDEAIIYTGMPLYLSHSDADKQEDKADNGEKKEYYKTFYICHKPIYNLICHFTSPSPHKDKIASFTFGIMGRLTGSASPFNMIIESPHNSLAYYYNQVQ